MDNSPAFRPVPRLRFLDLSQLRVGYKPWKALRLALSLLLSTSADAAAAAAAVLEVGDAVAVLSHPWLAPGEEEEEEAATAAASSRAFFPPPTTAAQLSWTPSSPPPPPQQQPPPPPPPLSAAPSAPPGAPPSGVPPPPGAMPPRFGDFVAAARAPPAAPPASVWVPGSAGASSPCGVSASELFFDKWLAWDVYGTPDVADIVRAAAAMHGAELSPALAASCSGADWRRAADSVSCILFSKSWSAQPLHPFANTAVDRQSGGDSA